MITNDNEPSEPSSSNSVNPYAASLAPVGPAQQSNLGKVIAIACLAVAGIVSLPFAFFFSCLGGLTVESSLPGGRGPGGDWGIIGGTIGVLLTILFFVWIIIKVARSGSARPALPYDRPGKFGNTPPFPAAGAPGENPFATPGENPFSDRSPS
jgi:hypothetical protein